MPFVLAAAVASVLVLPGLLVGAFRFEQSAPSGPGDARLDQAVRTELDRQWRLSGLEGIVVRPDYVAVPILNERDRRREIVECMRRAGVARWGYDESEGLFIEGGRPSASDQLAFYWCFAAYPTVDLVSDEQRDFIYDYYQRWLIPCLESRGYDVMNAPSREAFVGADRRLPDWSPYRALERFPPTFAALDALRGTCAPTVPGIAGWSER